MKEWGGKGTKEKSRNGKKIRIRKKWEGREKEQRLEEELNRER